MQKPKDVISNCPITTAQKVLSSKWSLMIIYFLKDKTMRFNELLRLFNGMTHATLAKQLKQLEQFGIVSREAYNQIPPKVEYSLTDLGRRLQPTLDCLFEWGQEYIRTFDKD